MRLLATSDSSQASSKEIDVILRENQTRFHLSGTRLYTLLSDERDAVIKSCVKRILTIANLSGVQLEVVPVQPQQLVKIQQGQLSQAEPTQDTDIMESAKSLLRKAASDGASDIHLISAESELRVMFRVDGDLVAEDSLAKKADDGLRLLQSFYVSMSDVADPTFKPKQAQDGNIAKKYLPAGVTSARMATRALPHGPLMVIRLQYPGKEIESFKDLGLEDSQVQSLERMARLPDGMVILLGATGSGKTTTLQKILARIYHLWNGQRHVLTIEDPVEVPIAGANQTASTKEDFAKAISQSMRLDPDIIMVGEMRDEATARAATQAALTGHLVFATLHAKSPVHALPRLKELQVEASSLHDPEILVGLVSVNLIKRLCQCAVPIQNADWDEWPAWKEAMGKHLPHTKICGRAKQGCVSCKTRGTKGRLQVCEIIETDEEFLALAAESKRKKANSYIRSKGVLTIYDHALLRILRGEVDPRDVEAVLGSLPERLGRPAGELNRDTQQACTTDPLGAVIRTLDERGKQDINQLQAAAAEINRRLEMLNRSSDANSSIANTGSPHTSPQHGSLLAAKLAESGGNRPAENGASLAVVGGSR